MIRRLEIKIIAVVLGTLLVVFAAVLLALNLSVYQTSVRRTDDFMAYVAENDGFMLPPAGMPEFQHGARRAPLNSPEMIRSGRFFYAKVNKNGGVTELNLEMMFDFSDEDAAGYASAAVDSGRPKGSIDNFSYLSAEKPYGQIIVFAERSIELGLLEQLTRASLWAAGIVSVILACLAALLAKWMVTPVKAAFDKQRRFISDASHELKTPLTIIGANADILRNEIGENLRLTHIREQSERMSGLVHDLLSLARTDEGNSGAAVHGLNLSRAVLSAALEFESRAFEEEKRYLFEIDEDIMYIGEEKQIKRLISILVDNAIFYSDPHGQIEISLRMTAGRPRISVYNTGAGVSADEYDKIFERFYRSDESRSRETGGYGIGLSIAKAIAESHKGKISVCGEYGSWIRFDVIL